jgi:hypothetical protein
VLFFLKIHVSHFLRVKQRNGLKMLLLDNQLLVFLYETLINC